MKLAFTALLLMLPAAVAAADSWTVYRMGPFEVFTTRDKKHARATLNHLEQFRWAFSYFTGKAEPKTLWPLRVVISRQPTKADWVLRNDGWIASLNEKDDVPREWNARLARLLIEANLGRMPREVEEGLVANLETAEVSGTHVIIGQPPARTDLTWARLHYLMTDEEKRGRVRVMVANLEKGVELDVALRNSLSITAAQLEADAKVHLDAKTVSTFDLAGKPLNAERDFTARVPDEDVIRRITSPANLPDTAMGLLEAGKAAEASALKPEWPEPWRVQAQQEPDAAKKGGLFKKAAEAAPRDSKLWTEFALLMTSYQRWVDADKAWAQALRAAEDPAAKEAIQAQRRELAEQRAAAEEEARRQAKLAEERELQNLKNEAVARIRAAEAKANEGKPGLDPNTKIVEWWDGPKTDAKVTGRLTRVDCAGSRLTLAVAAEGKTILLRVPDVSRIAIEGGDGKLTCGAQRPPKAIEVDYFANSREAAVVRFP
jgi:hypothetical protein